jgi:hypothetical protein
MERPINSDFTITQLWNHVTIKSPEDEEDTFSETSDSSRTTRYKVTEYIYNSSKLLNLPGRQLSGTRYASVFITIYHTFREGNKWKSLSD